MIGGGVLTECLDDDGILSVVSAGRTPLGRVHPKLPDIVTTDLFDLGARADDIVRSTRASTASGGCAKRILETPDIDALGA